MNRAKLITTVAMALAATALSATAYAQDAKSLAEPGKDWETFHGSYKSWNYSPLTQINTGNVSKLKVAFIQQVGRSTRGLETTPLAKDGILYYSGSYSKVFAVNGATGVALAGLSMTVFPAARAGAALRNASIRGKFQGLIAPMTPIGVLMARCRLPSAWWGITRP